MAITLTHPVAGMDTRAEAQLLTDQTNASDGQWVDVSHLFPLSIEISSLSSPDVCQVRISCALTQPLDSAHGKQLGANIKKGRTILLTHIVRFIKVRKSTGGGSATNAYLWGRYEVAR